MTGDLGKQTPPGVKVIFVLGEPGAGKGTQCSKLTSNYQRHHLSVGDVLRSELDKPNSEYASIIRRNMAEGRVGPPEITLALLKSTMFEKAMIGEGVKMFLIDGFPRKLDQARPFESTICFPIAALYLACPDSIQQESQKRFQTFSETSMQVIECYEKRGIFSRVDASMEVDHAFRSIEIALKHLIDPLPQPAIISTNTN